MHGKEQPRSRNDPPIEEAGKRRQHTRSVVKQGETRERRQRARDAAHSRSMVGAHRLLRDPHSGEHGLDDLLEDDGAEDLHAQDAVGCGDLSLVVGAVADGPGRAGTVEGVEEARGEPVGGHGPEDGEERVG